MKARELKTRLEEFQQKLDEHSQLWMQSLDSTIPDFPIRNTAQLRDQCRWLSRKLGGLKPYMQRFFSIWLMRDGTGYTWDSLEAAVGLNSVAQIKARSMQSVSEHINQILGELDTYDPEDEIPKDPQQPIRADMGIDPLMAAYLPHLHQYISAGCGKLFLDGHYAQAVQEAAKAVFQYIKDATGLGSDGALLAQKAFSTTKPHLVFGDLSDENTKNEQVGFMEMLKGFAKGVRNPLSHTYGKQEEALKAFEYLVMASLFCRRIDDAKPQE